MASIRERNGNYQIIVSLGYDIKGKKLLETTTYTQTHPSPLNNVRKLCVNLHSNLRQKLKTD